MKVETSHPDAQGKTVLRVEIDEAPIWANHLMHKMDNVEAKVDGMKTNVDGALQAAEGAKPMVASVVIRTPRWRDQCEI